MAPFYECCVFWLLVMAVAAKAFSQRRGLTLECVGNVMKLTLDSALSFRRQLEIEAINGSRVVPLSPALAAQCGYSVESDPWGNIRIYTSLLSCFAFNHDDAVFDIGLRLQLYGNRMSDDVIEVEKTCEYNQWASREILCERNFMEVSVHRGHPNKNMQKQAIHPVTGTVGFLDNEQHSITLGDIWRMVFYTLEETPMTLEEVQKAGYGVSVTPTRLVLRSPKNKPETFTDDVNGVQMEFLRVSTYFKRAWSVTIIDSIAVCPTGGLHFTNQFIKWYMPQYTMPIIMNPQHQILEMYMGINGKRLTPNEMKARGYTMMINEPHIIMSLPIGGPDGYYKSSVLDYTYHITYSIEPMLEILWLEGKSEVTRYKVHYPITTPPERRLPYITDNTAADSEVFKLMLGFFLPDVELLNITLSTGVLSVEEANEKGYNVQEHLFSNGSKAFSLEVSFFDPAVLRTKADPANVIYSLFLTFGLFVVPDYTPFSHTALVEVTRKDIVMFTMNGICDEKNFYVEIGHGNQGVNFQISIGRRNLTADLYTEYSVKENGTHVKMTVPFLAQDIVFEESSQSLLRARIDLVISHHNWQFKKFSLACSFPFIMTECFANGSITALAVKAEAANRMIPSQLRLRDPSCKPIFSNNRFAYFSFNANSCQTTRTFHDDIMTYRNEISMGNVTAAGQPSQNATKSGREYRMAVVCSYKLTKTLALTFSPGPQASALHADPGFGELHVRMRLATDASFDSFYTDEDYPVVQYLKHPLYFEVELMQSIDPQIELVLENCWASANHRGSMLTWDLIVKGCPNLADNYQITFYHVTADERVRYPSHVRRFKIDMFTFVKDNLPLHDQIRVHCETILCDIQHMDGICNTYCPLSKDENVKRGRRTMGQGQHRMWVSSGKISLSTS
ncbi:zona pellucida protein AX 1 [Clarias gariepinus]